MQRGSHGRLGFRLRVASGSALLGIALFAGGALAETGTGRSPAGDQYGRTIFRESFTVPIDFVVFNACTGEDVHVTGQALFRTQIVGEAPTPQSDEDIQVWTFLAVYQGVTGVGLTTGQQYTVRTTAHVAEITQDPPNFDYPRTVNWRDQFRIVSRDSSQDFVQTFRMHFRVTPDGLVVSSFESIESGCV